jgi:hypothetical protein
MKAQLSCGATVDVVVKDGSLIVEFGITPAPETKVEDFAFIKDGVLRVNMTIDSLLGLYQLITLMITPSRLKKPWWKF